MTRPRIAVAGFQHETNTFAPFRTPFEAFEEGGAWPPLHSGQEVLDTLSGLNIPLGGFIDEGDDFDLLPILWACAEPGGYVADDAFERISAGICAGIAAAGSLDGVYLDLHGAMVTESYPDGEGELLRRVRAVIGPDLPLAVSLDLHANLSPAFAGYASCITIYRTYPHVDMADTGARARRLLRRELDLGRPFAKAFRQLDFLIPPQAQSTRREPGRRLYAMLPEMEGGGVADVDFAFGFPPADIHDCGCSVVAWGTDASAVNAAADRIQAALAEAEHELHNPLIPAPEAVRQAIAIAATAPRPVILADVQDNPGAGASGDTPGLLAALVGQGARGAVLGMVWDPATAARAHELGIDAEFETGIGGRYPHIGGGPFACRVRVEALSDGSFDFTGPMYGGAHATFGPMAVLHIVDPRCDVRVVVGSKRSQNADQAIFRHIGIDPTAQRIVAVKSSVHFLADYEPIAQQVIFAEAPGANPCQLDTIPYTRLRPGVRLGPNGPPFAPE